MKTVSIIGIDIAKNVFHLHGAAADGEVIFRRKLTRGKLLDFVRKQPLLSGGNGGMWRSASLGPRTDQNGP